MDETSQLLTERFRHAEIEVADFFDPVKHTEISIVRARKAFPSFLGTRRISTSHLPFQDVSADKVLLILSAHEIRNNIERIMFFREINRVLKPDGQVVVTEHLRDLPNFLAYTIGFFHFHTKNTWLHSFSSAGFTVVKQIKSTPFITTFILEKNGTAS